MNITEIGVRYNSNIPVFQVKPREFGGGSIVFFMSIRYFLFVEFLCGHFVRNSLCRGARQKVVGAVLLLRLQFFGIPFWLEFFPGCVCLHRWSLGFDIGYGEFLSLEDGI